MFRIKNNLSPLSMQELFTEKIHQHNLRHKRSWETFNLRTVKYGTETIRHMGPKTWDLVPNYIKESKSLLEFQKKIKKNGKLVNVNADCAKHIFLTLASSISFNLVIFF